MNTWIELFKLITPALAGGGLVWLVTFRQRIRQARNAVSKEEFDTVSSIVRQSTNHIQEMAAMISEIQQIRIKLEADLQKCNAAAQHFKTDAERWKNLAQTPKQ